MIDPLKYSVNRVARVTINDRSSKYVLQKSNKSEIDRIDILTEAGRESSEPSTTAGGESPRLLQSV